MHKIYIAAMALAFFLMPVPANAGDLDGAASALENLADMARSADNAQDALRDAMNGVPSHYARHYYDRPYHYRHYYDEDDYYEHERRRAHYRHKMGKKRYKEWFKHHRHWDKPRHRPPHWD